jgi:hypothetical protein
MFSGKAGTGKSFCSDLAMKVCNELGIPTYKSPFAQGVKAVARSMGWDGQKDDKGRLLLQAIGRAGRAYDINVWAKIAFRNIESRAGYPFGAVFMDDWRFPSEISYVLDNELLYKPITIRVHAPDRESLVNTPAYYDESEVALDKFNFPHVVDNRKTEFTAHQAIKDIVSDTILKLQ